MAEICCGVMSESEASATCEQSSRVARRRRMEIRRFKFVSGVSVTEENGRKRLKNEATLLNTRPRVCESAIENCADELNQHEIYKSDECLVPDLSPSPSDFGDQCPRFGMMSVCGRRRDMEDAVSIEPSFFLQQQQIPSKLHFFGVFDGHGCSHVAKTCKERLHRLLATELVNQDSSIDWKETMERSFSRMDKEVSSGNAVVLPDVTCRCELQTPQSDAVGSTAVISVITHDKYIVANCGDSRAVLCRNGKAVPLSDDHKPDRPDELVRIQAAGGRVIYWDGARVLGVLAMSRAIGDGYLKPYVISSPEVTVTERSPEDECLILASDGLWDVVSNSTACDVVRMCLRGHSPDTHVSSGADKTCTEAAMLLTKLALARQSADNVSVVVVDLRNGGVKL